jgi:uncharacterized damage-inducible protein DinB
MEKLQGIAKLKHQMSGILSNIEPELYGRSLELFSGSSIGQHFRHIYDFFQALVKGMQVSTVDYAQRERDPHIELDPVFAIQAFESIFSQLQAFSDMQTVMVRAVFSEEQEQNTALYPSSLGRELTFVHDHAVHHMAMVKIALQQEAPHLLTLDATLGVAPSTLQYQKSRETLQNS